MSYILVIMNKYTTLFILTKFLVNFLKIFFDEVKTWIPGLPKGLFPAKGNF